MDDRLAELRYAAWRDEDDESSETEIFFRGQDVVDSLRRVAEYHYNMAKATPPYDHVKRLMHSGFSTALTAEADAYDVAIMQAMLNEAEDDG